MTSEFDYLSSTKDQVDTIEEAEEWVQRAKKFLENPNLDQAHWRKVHLRKRLISFLLNPHFPPSLAVKFIREQITVYNLFVPKYHNCKVELFMQFLQVAGADESKSLQDLDPSFMEIVKMFQLGTW